MRPGSSSDSPLPLASGVRTDANPDVGLQHGQTPFDFPVDRPAGFAFSRGDDTLVVEQWGADYRVLRGKKISDGSVELMQAS